MSSFNYFFMISFLQLIVISYKGCLCTISCFTCSSRNHSDIDCEDPFHPGPHSYTERCKVPKRGHIGEFPAHYCIKVTGTSDTTHEKLVIRRCVLGNMENQCGKFRLENDTLHGCILTCDLDGCNGSVLPTSNFLTSALLVILITACTHYLIGRDGILEWEPCAETAKNLTSLKPPSLNYPHYSPSHLPDRDSVVLWRTRTSSRLAIAPESIDCSVIVNPVSATVASEA